MKREVVIEPGVKTFLCLKSERSDFWEDFQQLEKDSSKLWAVPEGKEAVVH